MELYEIKQHKQTFQSRLEEIEALIDVQTLKQDIQALETKTYEPKFWDDYQSANVVIKDIKLKKERLSMYEAVVDKVENLDLAIELIELGEDDQDVETLIKETEKALDDLETRLFLSQPHDALNAVIEFHPGAGGTESQDWADMLYRMYMRFAEQKGFTFEVNDYQPGNEAGLKSATASIKGNFAYGFLKAENGVHRLVRISPFDSGGRRHTSFVSVNVFPELDDSIDIEVSDTDIKVDTYRSSGAGGQSVNTTDSAVRITHKETGIVVTCQNERSQIQNREKALNILKGKLYQLEMQKQHATLQEFKTQDQSNAFGSQIRSYVMHPYNMVKDHRTHHETGNVSAVLDGDIEPFINAFLKWRMKGDA